MKTRKKTDAEQRHDVFEATRALENLYVEADKFMDEFISLDGGVLFTTVTTLRDAIWSVRFEKNNLSAPKVAETYEDGETSSVWRYRDMEDE